MMKCILRYLGWSTLFIYYGNECSRLRVHKGSIKGDVVPNLECTAEEADSQMFACIIHL